MSLSFETLSRIGIVGAALALGACSNSDSGNPPGGGGAGSGGGGSGAGSPTGGTSSAGSNASGSSSGGESAGSSTGGSSTAGAAAGGASAGAAGNASGGSGGGGGGGGAGGASGEKSKTTFFVTSDTSMTGKLGGLTGADLRCQTLATAAGIMGHTFHAYLSTSTVNAKDRIGTGPWTNSAGVMVAADVAALHALKGNADLFIDEKKNKINGQWNSSNTVEHDILTGSMADGTVATGKTCMDWTSDAAKPAVAVVGHCDGMGPGMATTGTYSSWNSAHDNGGCDNTKPLGGAGRLYCFAID
jgi:hypothetical protein